MSLLEILPSLEGRISELLDRHKAAAAGIDWSYYDYLPLDAYHAREESPPLSDKVYAAVELALLTEANLPWYTATLHTGLSGSPAPLQEFVHTWTSEEDQHSLLLETYLLLTNNGDHKSRLKTRKAVLLGGWDHGLDGPVAAMAYTAVQELATRAFYSCTAEACDGEAPGLARALHRIAKDETLHMTFYRDVVKAHLDVNPDYIEPIAQVLLDFQMPGRVLPDYRERADYIAQAGIFGPEQFYRQVVVVLWSYWGLDEVMSQMSPERRAGLRLDKYRSAMLKLMDRYARRSANQTANSAANN